MQLHCNECSILPHASSNLFKPKWLSKVAFLQLLLNSFAIASKIDIQLGEVPKGQDKNVKKAHFIQVNIISFLVNTIGILTTIIFIRVNITRIKVNAIFI